MNIGIDTYPLVRGKKAGIGYYTYYLLKNIFEVDKDNEYFLYNNLGKVIDFSYPNVHLPVISGGSLVNKFSTLWMLSSAGRQLAKDKIDIFWGTQGIIPPNLSRLVKTIVTIHDLTFYRYPHTMAFDNYWVNRFLLKRSIVNASKVVAVSYSTAKDIRYYLDGKRFEAKISVIHSGIDTNRFAQVSKKDAKEFMLNKFNLSNPYILFVGTLEPRKNIAGLLSAFKILKEKFNSEHSLLLAGARGWKASKIFRVYKSLDFKKGEVRFLGYVSEDYLSMIYCAADIFVIPSLYEGFGFPPLEAMACGIPVVASDIPVFREVLGKSALLVNPQEPQEIAGGIYDILTNKRLRGRLVQDGLKRAKAFSWKDSAEKMIKLLNSMK